MEIKKEVTSCFYNCTFFGKSVDGMECQHPYFKDKEPYSNMIITHENSRDTIPEKCPLRKEQLVITYELRTTADMRLANARPN